MLSNLLTQTVSIIRPTATHDGSGAPEESGTTTIYKNIPANVQPASSQTIWLYQQRNLLVNYSIYTDRELTLSPGDRVVWDGQELGLQGHLPYKQGELTVTQLDCYTYA